MHPLTPVNPDSAPGETGGYEAAREASSIRWGKHEEIRGKPPMPDLNLPGLPALTVGAIRAVAATGYCVHVVERRAIV